MDRPLFAGKRSLPAVPGKRPRKNFRDELPGKYRENLGNTDLGKAQERGVRKDRTGKISGKIDQGKYREERLREKQARIAKGKIVS